MTTYNTSGAGMGVKKKIERASVLLTVCESIMTLHQHKRTGGTETWKHSRQFCAIQAVTPY